MNYPVQPLSNAGKTKNMRITQLIIIETGTYNQQFLRPYTMDVRADTMDLLKNTIQNSPTIASSTLAGISSQFFRPEAAPESQIIIPNGWNQKRYRFFMQVEYEKYDMTHQENILGYTEYDGISTQSNAIDEQMRFFVNSISTLRTSVIATANGLAQSRTVTGSSQVLDDNNWQPGRNNIYNTAPSFHLRPQDLFQVMSTSIERDSLGLMGDNVVDTRIMTSKEPVLSRRKNNLGATYTSTMINGFLAANNDAMGTVDDISGSAMGYVRDDAMIQDAFMSKLRSLAGTQTSAFTIRDLMNIDPNVNHVKKIVHLKPAERATLHNVGQTADWGDVTIETQYAAVLSQSIPSLMMDLGLVKAIIVSHNGSINGLPDTTLQDIKSFAYQDLTTAARTLITNINHIVIRDISYNNQMQYSFTASIDLMGESVFRISVNGSPFVDYCMPSFADAVLTPVTTMNNNRVYDISNQFNTLLSNLGVGDMYQEGIIAADMASSVSMPHQNWQPVQQMPAETYTQPTIPVSAPTTVPVHANGTIGF